VQWYLWWRYSASDLQNDNAEPNESEHEHEQAAKRREPSRVPERTRPEARDVGVDEKNPDRPKIKTTKGYNRRDRRAVGWERVWMR
jgi:hypothetical protein